MMVVSPHSIYLHLGLDMARKRAGFHNDDWWFTWTEESHFSEPGPSPKGMLDIRVIALSGIRNWQAVGA